MLSIVAEALTVDKSPLPGAMGEGAQRAMIQNGLNALFMFLGAVAVLMVVIGGFRYILSHGDSRIIEQSKNTILYAIIGLIVVIMASAIVNFVLRGL